MCDKQLAKIHNSLGLFKPNSVVHGMARLVGKGCVGRQLNAPVRATPVLGYSNEQTRHPAAPLLRDHVDPFEKCDRRTSRPVDVVIPQSDLDKTLRVIGRSISDELTEALWRRAENGHFFKMNPPIVVWPERQSQIEPAWLFRRATWTDHDAQRTKPSGPLEREVGRQVHRIMSSNSDNMDDPHTITEPPRWRAAKATAERRCRTILPL